MDSKKAPRRLTTKCLMVYKLISKVGDVSFSYINMDTNDTTSVSYAKSLAEENANDGFYQEFGNYILVGWDTGGNTENRIVITDSANNCTINFYIRTNNADNLVSCFLFV